MGARVQSRHVSGDCTGNDGGGATGVRALRGATGNGGDATGNDAATRAALACAERVALPRAPILFIVLILRS